ncbi:MAG: UbiA prenyltransferase family protein [Saprospiraceae bacterium]|nr:UbiA prenyltransferase family protein [Saprospiraceae bacterium]
MRPSHWIKNILIFVPAFFAQKIHLVFKEPALIYTFLSFSLAASIIYIVNDWFDVQEDRMHPLKLNRPLAARMISEINLLFFLVVLSIALIILLWLSNNSTPVLIYLGLNVAYTLRLKHIAIIDITSISIGFVLRIVAGAIAEGVLLTHWLITITFLLAMCLALGKRRSELIFSMANSKPIRKSLTGYNLEFINLALILLWGCTLVFYLMYCMSQEVAARMGTNKIYLTAFFVIIGIIRFFQIITVEQDLRSPMEVLMSDRFLQIVLLCCLTTFYLLIY